MRKENKYNRRHFVGTAAMGDAAAQLGTIGYRKNSMKVKIAMFEAASV